MAILVGWRCSRCGQHNRVAYATTRKRIMCDNPKCNAVYQVTGIRPDGTPILTYEALTSKLDRR